MLRRSGTRGLGGTTITPAAAGSDVAVLQRRIAALERLIAALEAELRCARLGIVLVADLEIDQLAGRVRRRGDLLDLKPKEYQLVSLLVRHVGEVVPFREVILRLYGSDEPQKRNSVAVHLSRLRKVLLGGAVSITTERGVGYRLVICEKQCEEV